MRNWLLWFWGWLRLGWRIARHPFVFRRWWRSEKARLFRLWRYTRVTWHRRGYHLGSPKRWSLHRLSMVAQEDPWYGQED